MHSEGRDFLHGVSAILAKSILQKIGKNIVKKFRLARVAERFSKEREKKGHTLGILPQGGQRSRSPNALSHEQLGSCADFFEENMEICLHNSTGLAQQHL